MYGQQQEPHRVELVSQGRVRCYRVKSRPYTYWQEQRASERFIDWQVELLVRADKRHDWGKVEFATKSNSTA